VARQFIEQRRGREAGKFNSVVMSEILATHIDFIQDRDKKAKGKLNGSL